MTARLLRPLLVVSPHCDDAVFACGAFIASSPGSLVVTVFAGSPRSYDPMTEWDRAAGLVPGDDVMHLRREEDWRALQHLNAVPMGQNRLCWLAERKKACLSQRQPSNSHEKYSSMAIFVLYQCVTVTICHNFHETNGCNLVTISMGQ